MLGPSNVARELHLALPVAKRAEFNSSRSAGEFAAAHQAFRLFYRSSLAGSLEVIEAFLMVGVIIISTSAGRGAVARRLRPFRKKRLGADLANAAGARFLLVGVVSLLGPLPPLCDFLRIVAPLNRLALCSAVGRAKLLLSQANRSINERRPAVVAFALLFCCRLLAIHKIVPIGSFQCSLVHYEKPTIRASEKR